MKDGPGWCAVRAFPLVAASLLLAGCTQGDPGGEDDGPVTSCPAWVKLPHNGQVIEGNMVYTNQTMVPDFERWDFMEPNATRPGQGIGDGHLREFDGHPLDQIVLDFHLRQKGQGQPGRILAVEDAEVTVSFFPSVDGEIDFSTPIEAWDQSKGQSSSKHEWTFGPTPGRNFGYHNVTLRIDLAQPDEEPRPQGVFVHWVMTPNLDNDIDTASLVVMHYAPEFWYRTCSSDGTRH